MRRPVGVILTCIVLGFIALALLMSAAGSLFVLAIAGHLPLPVQPGQPTPDPAVIESIMHCTMIAMALVETALAAWAIATLVGLARMKNWARYSVMIIGGGLALIGVVSAIGMVFAQAFVSKIAQQPGQDPTHIRVVMIIGSVFYLGIAAIGIWWLIYFALRSTRAAFALAATPQAPPPIGYAPPPSPYAASTYEVAAYIPVRDPTAPPVVYPTPMPVQVMPTSPARPLAISIIAWLLIAAAVCCLPVAFFPFPLFMCGIFITGLAAHLTILCLAVIYALVGIGLLRLEKIALYTALAIQLFGLVNVGLLLLPSYRDRMVTYQQNLMQKMMMGMPMPPIFDNHTMGLLMIPGALFGFLLGLAVLALLIHYRTAFDRPSQTAA